MLSKLRKGRSHICEDAVPGAAFGCKSFSKSVGQSAVGDTLLFQRLCPGCTPVGR
jgi:hypothetical protein